jgi:hypothetical protein
VKEIRIYDSARDPRHFSALVEKSQYVVSHYDYKTGTWRTSRGKYASCPEEETILIFDALAEAENYCREHVEKVPSLFCKIYDWRGAGEGQIEAIYPRKIAEKIQGPRAARVQLLKGLLLLLIAALCVFVDWRLGGPVILGVVVGSKFLTSGIALTVQGVVGMIESRAS